MRNRKKLIAAATAAVMIMTLAVSAPVLASEEASQEITGDVISDEAVRAEGDSVISVKDSVITAEGSMRPVICSDSAALSLENCLAVSDVWAVLPTGQGSGALSATDTVAIIGALTDEENSNCQVNIGGTDYFVDALDSTESFGYVTSSEGFDLSFSGCMFLAPDCLAALTGGAFSFTSSETQRGYGASDRIGFLSRGNGYSAVLSHADFEVADTLFSDMSKGNVDITMDDVQVGIYGQSPWSGVLMQFMDADADSTEPGEAKMDVLDLTYDEYQTIEPAGDGNIRTVRIANSNLRGDIYNSAGSSNRIRISDIYDGTTGILSDWNTSLVNITLDNVALDGVISTSYAQHVDEEGNPIEGLFYLLGPGEALEEAEEDVYDVGAGSRVINTPAYNGLAQINLTMTGETVWKVTGTSILNSMTVEDGSFVIGTLTENEDGTITLEPSDERLEEGTYGTVPELHNEETENTVDEPAEGE